MNGHEIATASVIPSDTLEVLMDGLKRRHNRYRKRLCQAQKAVSESSVHDLRIEARRLLALFDLLGPFLTPGRLAKGQSALKCHLDTFDQLRDTQVQLASVKQLKNHFSAGGQFQKFLKKKKARLSRRARKQSNRLRNKPLSKVVAGIRSDCSKWLKRFGPSLANPLLVRGLAEAFGTVARLKQRIHPQDTRSIHRTRIAFKRFRYMVELLRGQAPWADPGFLGRLRRYQKLMGDVQDAEVLRRAFNKFARKKELKARPAEQAADELLRRRQDLIARYLASAGRLDGFWPPPSPAPAHAIRAPSARLPSHRPGRNRSAPFRSLPQP